MFLDLDRFKEINDNLGHGIGEGLLKEVAMWLNTCVRAGDTVARKGGDEFIVALSEISNPEAATLVAEKIIQTFGEPVLVGGRSQTMSTSIGIAVCAVGGAKDAQTLLRMADEAMFTVKNSGRNGYRLYVSSESQS